MKYFIFILLLFVSCGTFAQTIQNKVLINPPAGNRNTIAHQADSWFPDSLLMFPTGCGIPAINMSNYMTATKHAAFYHDSCGKANYTWQPETNTWEKAQGAIDSIFIRFDSIFIITNNDTVFIGFTGIDSTTASNGLRLVGKDVRLGGSLTSNTTITTGASNLTINTITASVTPLMTSATTGNGISAFSSSGFGGYFHTFFGIAGQFDHTDTAVGGIEPIIQLSRTTFGTPINGIGGSVDFNILTPSGSAISNQIISKWTNAITVLRTSEFSITGLNNGSTNTLFTLGGNGAARFNQYGLGNFVGTPTFALNVDANGNIIEGSVGGGGTNQFLTAGYGLLGLNYNGSAPVTWAVDTSIITSSTVNNVFNGTDSVVWIVDSIRCDTTGSAANTNYLVCHTPTGGFAGHADLIANRIGSIWNYQTPHNGDLLSDAKPISYYQWDSVHAVWVLRSRAVLVGNTNYGGNLQIGTSSSNGIRLATKNINAISIDTSQRVSLPKFGIARSGNYLFLDSITLNIDTGYFKPLVAGTNITINSGVAGDTINSTGGGSGPTLTHLSYHGQLNGTDTILQYRTYNVLDFGIVGDSSTDNYAKLQSLDNYVASLGGGEIFFPKGNYKVLLPPTLNSNTHWKGIGPESHVFNPLTVSIIQGDTYCYFMGNFATVTYGRTLNYALADTVRAGSNQVKLTSAQTDSFSIGNIVQLFSTTGFNSVDGTFKPYYAELNKILSIDRTNGFMYLKYPFDTTMINIKIANTTKMIAGNPVVDALGNHFYIADNCSVENMSFQSSDYVARRYGAFECNILNNFMISAKGVGGNGLSWCNFEGNTFNFSYKAIETAFYTHNTKIEDNTFSYRPGLTDTSTVRAGIKIGENTRNLLLASNYFTFGDTTNSGPVLSIDHGFNNIIRGNKIYANKVRLQAFNLNPIDDTARIEGNSFVDNEIWADSLLSFINTGLGTFINASVKNNIFINNKFHGIPASHAFIIGGNGTTIIGGYVQTGDISIDATAANYNYNFVNAATNSIIQASGTNTFNGDVKLNSTGSGNSSDSVLTENPTSHKVNWRSATSFISGALSRQTITSGTSGTVTSGSYIIVTIDPASTLAAYDLTLPATPFDLQTVEIDFGGTLTSGAIVTALSILPNSGQTILDNTPPTSATADNTLLYRYDISHTTWRRFKP